MHCLILYIKIEIDYRLYFCEDMSNSKPCATWFEVFIVTIVCILIGACIYISLQDVPARNENTTNSMIPITPVKSAHVKSALKASITTPAFIPIQLSTPKSRPLKLIIIKPEGT